MNRIVCLDKGRCLLDKGVYVWIRGACLDKGRSGFG